MKRYGYLWPSIITYENLWLSARKAQKGKRFRDNVLEFNFNLEKELLILQNELKTQTYCPGAYKTFHILEPKPRLISAAPYRDRVVHHALCTVITPIFERSFIPDSYANRVGYGSHRALRRFTQHLRSSRYVLQCDIRKYFPSIDHEILKSIIRLKIKCPETLWLIDTLIDGSNQPDIPIEYFPGDDLLTPISRRKGLPIGNLTSQFFANIYLNGLDHFVNEKLRIGKYLRYVDDFALFSNNQIALSEARIEIEAYLEKLRLKVHPIKSQLFETRHGANFVGFRVHLDRIRVRSDNLKRARRRLMVLKKGYANGTISFIHLNQSIQSWIAHLKHGDTWRLRQSVFESLSFQSITPQ
jgi:retron-type reverse transcriptase